MSQDAPAKQGHCTTFITHGGEEWADVVHEHCWFHSTKGLCFQKLDAVGPFKLSPFFLEGSTGDGFQDSLCATCLWGRVSHVINILHMEHHLPP